MREKIYEFKNMKVLTGDLPWDQLWRHWDVLPERGLKRQRERMVSIIRQRGVDDVRVLRAMESTLRHEFVSPSHRHRAYEDRALPIAADQSISQPYIVAFMTQLLRLRGDERVLEIGTGSGYQTAILAQLARHVFTIEIKEELQAGARLTLDAMGLSNITYRLGDGWSGWPENAPFDRILVAAAPPSIPRRLVEQIAPGGRLVIPVGSQQTSQTLFEIERLSDGTVRHHHHGAVLFVPMIGDVDS